MDSAAKARLRQFIEDNIPFKELKAAGFFDKGVRKTDYEKIAARVCHWFGYKSIYEYKKVCRGKSCDGNNCGGTHKECRAYNPLKEITSWPQVRVDFADLISQDKFLN
jgi:hypothetical protein